MFDPNQPTEDIKAFDSNDRSLDAWLSSAIKLRSNLRWSTHWEQQSSIAVVEDPVRNKFFRLGDREYRLIRHLDGRATLAQAIEQTNLPMHSHGPTPIDSEGPSTETDTELTRSDAVRIAQWLVQNNLAVAPHLDNAKRLNEQSKAFDAQACLSRFNPISLRFKLFNPDPFFRKVQPYLAWWFSVWFLVIWLLVGGIALATTVCHWDRLNAASAGVLSADRWIWLGLIWIALKIIHELAHGIACRRYGGEVPQAGVLLLLFAPMAFVDVTSMWRFRYPWQRMVVAAAGMYVELFISFLAVLTWATAGPELASLAFDVLLMASVTTLLFNANPLMRFDGYYLLSDWLSEPNLYSRGQQWLRATAAYIFLGIPRVSEISESSWQVRVYGCLAFLWRISISISLVLAASVMFHGAGLALSAVAIALWFGIPAIRSFKRLWKPDVRQQLQPRRILIAATSTLLLLLAMTFGLSAPATKSAPAVVRLANESVVRAPVNGFVVQLDVTDGQQVFSGQRILELDNPELEMEVEDLRTQLQQATIQERIYRQQRQLAQAQAEAERIGQLKCQLQEKQDALEQLSVLAPQDGVVLARNLEQRMQTYVRQGDPLLSVVDSNQQEVVALIDQRDFDEVNWKPGTPVRLLFPGQKIVEGELSAVNPRATTKLVEPELAVLSGGPLPVRLADDSAESNEHRYRLLSPRFSVTIRLHAGVAWDLRAGQRGRIFFSTTRQSLGRYLVLAVDDWLRRKLEQAIAQQ